MDFAAELLEVEIRAKRIGASMRAVCEEAGIHPGTVSRWKLPGKGPQLQKWQKVLDAIARLERQRAA